MDQDLFLRAMMSDGVKPIADDKVRVKNGPPPPGPKPAPVVDPDDFEVLRTLADLVDGRIEFDLSFSEEHIEGHVRGFPPQAMERLRQGLIPTQDHLDLHGMTLAQAEEAIHKFITKSVSLRRTCVILVHGRGHRSPGGVPVIKRNLETMLLRRGVKRHILAFTTAKPIDGGLGASYILLRNPGAPK
jgi:DNA-nicking Smr family endonuclease